MDLPRFSFSPPRPRSEDRLDEVIRRLEAIERELLLLKRRVAKLEGKEVFPPRADLPRVPPPKDKPMPAAAGQVVLLERIDVGNVRVIETLLDWVQFIMSKVGPEGFPEIIEYYREIGWISDEVADLLLRYAQGLRVDVEYPGYMLPEDHAKSLDYISRIKEAMR